jgi:hypothetical protein
MVALFVLQITVLAIVGVILAILMILAIWDHHRVRYTENFLLGSAYGLTLGVVLATLYTVTIPN